MVGKATDEFLKWVAIENKKNVQLLLHPQKACTTQYIQLLFNGAGKCLYNSMIHNVY